MMAKTLMCSCLCIFMHLQVWAQKPVDLFSAGQEPRIACYRIPALATTPSGTLLAAADQRLNTCQDLGRNPDIDIVLRRSTDHGRTWTSVEKVVDLPEGRSASDPSFIVERFSGRVFLFFNSMDHAKSPGIYRLNHVFSDDNGRSWSTPSDITDELLPVEERSDFIFITSGNGHQDTDGNMYLTVVNVTKGHVRIGISEDRGKIWRFAPSAVKPADESRMAVLSNGEWMVNARINGAGHRMIHRSSDKGRTWHPAPDTVLLDPGCNAGLIVVKQKRTDKPRTDKPLMVFSNPASSSKRERLTIRISQDDGRSWTDRQLVHAGPAAYSDIAQTKKGDLAVLFERDDYAAIRFLRLTDRLVLLK